MKVKILSRKLIKPCTPTPDNLRTYKIASIDEINPTMNVVGILYYPFHDNMERILNKMEESLSQILPQFYPFAGRYMKEAYSVDCNDEGAEYVEARVDCELLDIIGSGVEPGELNDLLPLEVGAADEFTDPILSIKINKFKCGGIAIGTCISHRIVDACSLGIFLSAWANATRGDTISEPITPNFDSPLYFPGRNLGELDFGTTRTRDSTIVTKRILFDKKMIANLRDRVSHLYVKRERPPSRVLMVTSFLTEALLRSDRAKLGKTRACLIHVAANIRERTVPPLSKYSCGNLVSMGIEEYSAEETKILDFERLVPIVDTATRKAVAECANLLSNGEYGYKVMVDEYIDICEKSHYDNLNCLWFTDWSKFGFYEKDFGFGTPAWTSIVSVPVKNLIILMNIKENDGIEAWLHLHEEDVHYFEQDREIKKLIA